MSTLAASVAFLVAARADNVPDVLTIPPDLDNPVPIDGSPAPGKQVLQSLPAYAGSEVKHALYLPVDWVAGKQYPVIVEYRGNNHWVKEKGGLGYGLSGGSGFIWVVLPYVGIDHKADTNWWWGDLEATVAYAKEAVPAICRQWGGDPARVVLVGHSRGAIACNYVGLHDDDIAGLWRAMIVFSHYDDGHINWGMSGEESGKAADRLRRLKAVPQLVCGEYHLPRNHNDGVLRKILADRKFQTFEEAKKDLGLIPMLDDEGTRKFVVRNHPQGRYTFADFPYGTHSADYVLRNIPERKFMRDWLQDVVERRQ